MFGIQNILALGAGLLIGYAIGLLSGMPIGKNIEQGSQAVAVVEEVKQNVKAKQKVNSFSNDELKRAYCHWVFDVSYDECLRTNIYVN